MGKSSGPRPPDPVRTARAQADINREAAIESARLNQINQWTPWGGTYWTGEIGAPDRTQHTVYNPILGRILLGDSYHPHFGGYGGMGALAAPLAAAASGNAGLPRRPIGGGGGEAYGMPSYGGGSVDPGGADHLGAGGLMDMVDAMTGGALSGMHNAGVDEFGGLAATGLGGAGWDVTGSGMEDGGDFGADFGDIGGWDDAGGFDAWYMGGPTGGGRNMTVEPEKIAGLVHEGEYVIPHDRPDIQGLASVLMSARPAAKREPMPMTTVQGSGDLASMIGGRM